MTLHNLVADLYQGVRLLTRAPGFSTLAVSMLASGIGAATMMFSLVHAALLRALPFDDPDRVVWMYNLRTERDRAPLSAPDVDDYRRQASSLLSTMHIAFPDRPAPPPGEVPQAHFGVATPGYFAAAGIMVQAGRAFTDHDRADGQPVAVVSRSALGARGRDLSALMFRGELPPVAIGICSGLASAYGGAPYLFATPFETDPRYATIYLAVGAGLLSVAALAIYLPGRGARSVNPHEALSL